MLDSWLGIMLHIALLGLGIIRATEIVGAGVKALYKGRSPWKSSTAKSAQMITH